MSWIEDRAKHIREEREEKMKEKGYNAFLRLGVGSTRLEVDVAQPPRELKGKYSPQYVLPVKTEGSDEVKDWAVSEFVLNLVTLAVENVVPEDGWIKICVVKVGGGKDTRWDIKAGW